jgi:type IV secretion system protein TrbG
MKNLQKISLVLCAIAALVSTAQAQTRNYKTERTSDLSSPVPMHLDPRIRTFAYNADVVFNLPISVGLHTHIVMGADEELIETPKLGETVQWRVTGNARNLYIKALKPDAVTSLTLVTDKRIYQFELRSTTRPELRIQKLVFDYPEQEDAVNVQLGNDSKNIRAAFERQEASRKEGEVQQDELFKKSAGYRVKGNGELINVETYDDGVRTFVRMPAGVQDLPAVFLAEGASLSPVNYTVERKSISGDRDILVIERRAREWLLKLGKAEARIVRQ